MAPILLLASFVLAAGSAMAEDPAADLEERVRRLEDQIRQNAPSPTGLEVTWKEGIYLQSRDRNFRIRLGGEIMNDWIFFPGSESAEAAVGDLEEGTEFRRARLYVWGGLYDHLIFKSQYDFSGGRVNFKDLFVGLQGLPVAGNVIVGHFREPFGLDAYSSEKFITFIEPSLLSALHPDRNTGVMAYNQQGKGRWTWALGFFHDADDFGNGTGGSAYSATGRLAGLPLYLREGRIYAHLGVSYSHRNIQDNQVRYRTRPEAHLAPYFIDTGDFSAERAHLLAGEALQVLGPVSFQGEYWRAWLDRDGAGNPSFFGCYAMASWILTGEHRPYFQPLGVLDMVRPRRNFMDGAGGLGAWEIAARYSRMDLSDQGIAGGKLADVTGGLNWYLNPYARLMANYVRAELNGNLHADIFQTRIQVYF